MKNKTLLNSKFSSYTALAVALLAAKAGDTQTIYTDVDPDVVIAGGDNYTFDLDDDGTDDFRFVNAIYSGIGAINIVNYTSNGIAGYMGSFFGSSFPFASALDAGQVIGPGLLWYSSASAAPLLWGTFVLFGTLGDWGDVSDKYLGLRIKIGGADHYGWARLDVIDGTATLKDFAYNATANAAINTSVGIETEGNNFNPAVYAIEDGVHITLPDNIENANISIFDLSGRVIHSEFIFNEANIKMINIPKGMYLIKVQNGEQFFTKMLPLK